MSWDSPSLLCRIVILKELLGCGVDVGVGARGYHLAGSPVTRESLRLGDHVAGVSDGTPDDGREGPEKRAENKKVRVNAAAAWAGWK